MNTPRCWTAIALVRGQPDGDNPDMRGAYVRVVTYAHSEDEAVDLWQRGLDSAGFDLVKVNGIECLTISDSDRTQNPAFDAMRAKAKRTRLPVFGSFHTWENDDDEDDDEDDHQDLEDLNSGKRIEPNPNHRGSSLADSPCWVASLHIKSRPYGPDPDMPLRRSLAVVHAPTEDHAIDLWRRGMDVLDYTLIKAEDMLCLTTPDDVETGWPELDKLRVTARRTRLPEFWGFHIAED